MLDFLFGGSFCSFQKGKEYSFFLQCEDNKDTDLSLRIKSSYISVAKLEKALKTNKNIVSLDFSDNLSGIKGDEMINIIDTIADNINGIKKLFLNNNGISGNDFMRLVWKIKEKSVLEYIDLSENFISSRSVILFFKSLGVGCNLIYIDLSCNEIDKSVIGEMSNLLNENRTIKYLTFSGNNDVYLNDLFSEPINKSFASANSYIQGLGVECKPSCVWFEKFFSRFPALSILDISESVFEKGDIELLCSCLETNKSVTLLNLDKVVLDTNEISVINDMLSINKTLNCLIVSGEYKEKSSIFSCDSFEKIVDFSLFSKSIEHNDVINIVTQYYPYFVELTVYPRELEERRQSQRSRMFSILSKKITDKNEKSYKFLEEKLSSFKFCKIKMNTLLQVDTLLKTCRDMTMDVLKIDI